MTTTTIPSHTPTPPPSPAAAEGGGAPKTFLDRIPEEFRDRPYLKDIAAMPADSPEALTAVFKKLDGAEKLVGKKTGIPEAGAPQEEWDQFFAKLRPEKEDDYEIKTPEGQTSDEGFVKAMKSAAHKAGLTKAQLAKMHDALVSVVGERQEALSAEQKKLDDEFDALVKSTFGDGNTAALDRAKTMLQEFTPDNVKAHIPKLSNEALVILAGVLNAVHSKYGKEDKVGGSGSTTVADTTDLREQARKLMASPEYKDSFNPRHAEVVSTVQELYKKIAVALDATKNKK